MRFCGYARCSITAEDTLGAMVYDKSRVDYGYSTFTDLDNNHTFGFVSAWQLNLLLNSKEFCLDATHSISNVKNLMLYTLVARHPLTGTGCPVGHPFTKSQEAAPITNFLHFIKDLGLDSPVKFTIDVCHAERVGIQRTVYPGCCSTVVHVSGWWSLQ